MRVELILYAATNHSPFPHTRRAATPHPLVASSTYLPCASSYLSHSATCAAT